MYKICSKCNKKLLVEEYYGNHAECKTCFKARAKLYRDTHKDHIVDYQIKYRKNNIDKIKATKRLYRNNNLEHFKYVDNEYYINNKEIRLAYNKKYREENKQRLNSLRKERYHNDIQFRLRSLLRGRLRHALHRNSKKLSALSLLGCSIKDFRAYLESRFKSGMTWENFGFGHDKWNLDHIIPCDKFDLQNESEQKICFHYSNIQPLWQIDNFKKGKKVLFEKFNIEDIGNKLSNAGYEYDINCFVGNNIENTVHCWQTNI